MSGSRARDMPPSSSSGAASPPASPPSRMRLEPEAMVTPMHGPVHEDLEKNVDPYSVLTALHGTGEVRTSLS